MTIINQTFDKSEYELVKSYFNNNEKINGSSRNLDSNSNKNHLLVTFLQQETSLIWIIFGTIGNLLSLFVLLRRKMRIHSTFTYLTILAICDTLVLYFGLLRDFLVNKYNFDINGDILCKFHVFSFYFVLHMASWLLVAVNIDRLIASSFLSLSKKWCTPRTAIKVSLYLALILFLLNSHFIYFVNSAKKLDSSFLTEENDDNKNKNNKYNNKSDNLSSNVYLLLDNYTNNLTSKNSNFIIKPLVLKPKIYFVAPDSRENEINNLNFITHITDLDEFVSPILNSKVNQQEPINPYVYKSCLIKENHPYYNYFFQNIFTWIDASAQVILPFMIMVICNINIIHKVLLTKNKTNGKNLKRLRKIKGMCIMIISVSILFFILEFPVLIFICLMQGEYIKYESPYIEILWTIVNLMMYTNHVINFISYCMTGTKFRRELLRLLYIDDALNYFTTKQREVNYIPRQNLKLNQSVVINNDELNNQGINNSDKKEPFQSEFKLDQISNKNETSKSLTYAIVNIKNKLGKSSVHKQDKSSKLKFLKNKIEFSKYESSTVVDKQDYDLKNFNTDLIKEEEEEEDYDANKTENETSVNSSNRNCFLQTDKRNNKKTRNNSEISASQSATRASFKSFKRKINYNRETVKTEKKFLDELDIEIDEESDVI